MRRDHFNLDLSNVAWVEANGDPSKPRLIVGFDGEPSRLRTRLSKPNGDLLDSRETDVSFRLNDSVENPETRGVVAITNRLTGDYILELNIAAADIFEFITAARRYGERTDETTQYTVRISGDDEPIATYEKRTLLVYSHEGELLRGHSLIPSGVEI